MSEFTFRFSGNGGMPVAEFVKNVAIRANAEGKQLDNRWNVEFAVTCLSGPALKWYKGLDKDTRGDWSRLRKALEEKYDKPEPSSPLKSMWRRATGSRGPSRSNSLAEPLDIETVPSPTEATLPSYQDVISGTKFSSSSGPVNVATLTEEPSAAQIDPSARRLRVISTASRKELGYVLKPSTPSHWLAYTADVTMAMQVKLREDGVMILLNGPVTVKPPLVLIGGWSAEGRAPFKDGERYASLTYYEEEFLGFTHLKGGWKAKWEVNPTSRTIKPFQNNSRKTFALSVSRKSTMIRLHSDLKAYKNKDPDTLEVEIVLEPLK